MGSGRRYKKKLWNVSPRPFMPMIRWNAFKFLGIAQLFMKLAEHVAPSLFSRAEISR